MTRRALASPLALVLLLAATGCSSLIPGADRQPPRLYEPSPKTTFATDLPTIRHQIIVETPQAAAGLNTAKIAIKEKRHTLDYYARVEWTDVAPRLVQTMVLKSFENTRKVLAVGREGSGLRADYIVKIDLRNFQAELYDGDVPEANVEFIAKLVRMPDREIVADFAYQRKWKAKSKDLDDVIDAFNESLGGVMKRIVEWAIREIDRQDKKGLGRRRAGR
jgi:cholesterol transport system auxiliary component